jgi:hypothetical protein
LIAASVAAVAIVALSGDLNDPAVGLLSIGNDGVCPCHPAPPPAPIDCCCPRPEPAPSWAGTATVQRFPPRNWELDGLWGLRSKMVAQQESVGVHNPAGSSEGA